VLRELDLLNSSINGQVRVASQIANLMLIVSYSRGESALRIANCVCVCVLRIGAWTRIAYVCRFWVRVRVRGRDLVVHRPNRTIIANHSPPTPSHTLTPNPEPLTPNLTLTQYAEYAIPHYAIRVKVGWSIITRSIDKIAPVAIRNRNTQYATVAQYAAYGVPHSDALESTSRVERPLLERMNDTGTHCD